MNPAAGGSAAGSKGNAARNIIAGILAGYGVVSFICFLYLDQTWAYAAPHEPNGTLGLLYLHNNHGDYTYFSAFQATTCRLMFATSIPLAFVGVLIAPKKNVAGTVRWYAASFNWDQDDPRNLMKWAMGVSAAATPPFVFFVGPLVINSLNSAGFVMNLG